MKVSFHLLAVLSFPFLMGTSCKKEAVSPDTQNNTSNSTMAKKTTSQVAYTGSTTVDVTFCGPGVTKDLCAGQSTTMGKVTVNRKGSTVYVTYQTNDNWYFTNLKLYVADQDQCAIPVNSAGNVMPGQFPFQQDFSSTGGAQTYTFIISGFTGSCFCVAAHADVVQKDAFGSLFNSQTAWGDGCNGTRITPRGNWATEFTACIPDCGTDDGDGNM